MRLGYALLILMPGLRGRCFILILGGVWGISPATLSAATVKFKDLAATRLPYGEAISITGDVKDFVANDSKLGMVTVADWISIKTISVAVTVSGLSPRSPVDATVTNTAWTASIDPLPKNSSVKFDFQLKGNLNAGKAGGILNALSTSDDYKKALDAFFLKATKATPEATAQAASSFADAIAPVIKAQFPEFLAPSDPKTIADSLRESDSALIGLLNATDDLNALLKIMRGMRVAALADVTDQSTPAEAFKLLDSVSTAAQVSARAVMAAGAMPLQGNQPASLLSAIETFKADYVDAIAGIGRDLVARLTLSKQLSEVSTVEDFAKYAGIDVGVLYAPPIQSLRGYFTINVYLGSVEDTPAPVVPCQPGAKPKSLDTRMKESAARQAQIEEAKAKEQAAANTLQARKDALQKASPGQIASATQDRDLAQKLLESATALRQQLELTAVEESSAPPPSGRTCGFSDSRFWQVFQQRFSISGGVSVGDISGQQSSPFASDYAYVAGAGWRLNKYFRLLAGDLLYRNKTTDRINHAFTFGVSVDFAALGNITTVFGKVK